MTLAREQFDDHVKRVRVFSHPRVTDDLRSLASVSELLVEAIERAS